MLNRVVPLLLLASLSLVPSASAQLACRESGRNDRWGERFCTIETQSIRPGGTVRVDGTPNGGVTVIGWDRHEIELRARISATARSVTRAEEIGRAVRIVALGTELRAEGPRTADREGWSVDFELRVPKQSDLWVRSRNGGIDVDNVSGDIDLATRNGGLSLTNLAGSVEAETTNGGVDLVLAGSSWDGRGLTVRTTNGGVDVRLPQDYSAEFEAATTNGGLDFDFPVRVQGRIGRRVRTTLGNGGPPISVVTTNGGVEIRHR